jgi:hypothetical protein
MRIVGREEEERRIQHPLLFLEESKGQDGIWSTEVLYSVGILYICILITHTRKVRASTETIIHETKRRRLPNYAHGIYCPHYAVVCCRAGPPATLDSAAGTWRDRLASCASLPRLAQRTILLQLQLPCRASSLTIAPLTPPTRPSCRSPIDRRRCPSCASLSAALCRHALALLSRQLDTLGLSCHHDALTISCASGRAPPPSPPDLHPQTIASPAPICQRCPSMPDLHSPHARALKSRL